MKWYKKIYEYPIHDLIARMGGIFITVGDLFACGMEIHPKTPPEVAAHINDFKSIVIQAESGNIKCIFLPQVAAIL